MVDKKRIGLVCGIYGLALLAPALASAAVPDPDVLWWKFDEGTGAVAKDSSGQGHDGTITGATWKSGGVGGTGYCLDFPASQAVRVEDKNAPNYLNGLGAVTVSLWIKSRVTSSDNGFIIAETPAGNDNEVTIRYDAAGSNGGGTNVLKMGVTSTSGLQQYETASGSQTTDWQHVTLTWQTGVGIKFYLNGKKDTPTNVQAVNTGTISGVTTLIVGLGGKDSSGNPGTGWNGLIDDVRIYSSVLTDAQIAELAKNKPLNLKASAPTPADGAIGVGLPLLQWTKGDTAIFHNVYLGTTPDLTAANQVAANSPGPMVYYAAGFQSGTKYYWRVDEVEADLTTIRTGDVWSFTSAPTAAFSPNPRDGDKWIAKDSKLTWQGGQGAISHEFYFGTDKQAVTDRGASVSQGKIIAPLYTPKDLADNTTYYWVVDELDMTGKRTPGTVWSFTTIGAGGGVKGEYFNGMTPGGTPGLVRVDPAINFTWGDPGGPGAPIGVDGFSARWTADLEIAIEDTYTFIVNCDDGARLWLDDQLIIDTWVNQSAADHAGKPMLLKPGVYSLRMEYYENTGGATAILLWTNSVATRQVIPAGPLQLPLKAKPSYPQNGDVNVPQDATLMFSAGDKAAKHALYFGADKDAVTNGTTPTATQAKDELTFNPGALDWNTTYYWRVDEINDAATGSPWVGSVWSFTTADFLVVDNMETYDDADNRIYDTWLDNFGDEPGAIVGNDPAPFAEQRIVHGGKQSLPLTYDNAGPKHLYSETVRTFDTAQNWTVNGVKDLSLWVRGYPAVTGFAVTETAGKMSVTGSGTDIWNNSDQFSFAYKTLTGDGSIVACVTDKGTGTNTWAKGGVMIRDSLNGGSTHAMMVLSANSDGAAGNGYTFQRRLTTDGASTSDDGTAPALNVPYWVKIQRVGDSFSASVSADGKTWRPQGTAQTITMRNPVYIGICVTSHNAAEQRTFQFAGIATTGNVNGSWQGAQIMNAVSNSAEGLYVTVEDSTGKKFTLRDAAAVNSATWYNAKFPLSSFTGVNAAKVKKLSISVGDPKTTVPGGSGKIFLDDICVTKP